MHQMLSTTLCLPPLKLKLEVLDQMSRLTNYTTLHKQQQINSMNLIDENNDKITLESNKHKQQSLKEMPTHDTI